MLCLLSRDQLHQTGQGAAGGRGPAAGHTCGGRYEATGRCSARALTAHRPHCHHQDSTSEKQEKPSVSAKSRILVPAVHFQLIISTLLLSLCGANVRERPFFFSSSSKTISVSRLTDEFPSVGCYGVSSTLSGVKSTNSS